MNRAFSSLPMSRPSCLTASRNGMDSISPTVPPSSTIATSASEFLATPTMRDLISSVIWGMICTVLPRYCPLRSLSMTERYTFPVVMLLSLPRLRSVKRS